MMDMDEFYDFEDGYNTYWSFSGKTAYDGGTVSYSGSTYIASSDPLTGELTIYKRSENGWFMQIINEIKKMFGMKIDKTKNGEFQSWNKPSDIPNHFRLDKNRTLKKPETPIIRAIIRDKK